MSNTRYAGFWWRMAAFMIDMVIICIVFGVPLALIYGDAYFEPGGGATGGWDVLLGNVAPAVITVWFWLRYLGTPGKMLLKLRVIDAKTGEKLGVGQAIVRYVAYIPSTIVFGLGYVWIAFDDKKQGWHDKISGSVVVREN